MKTNVIFNASRRIITDLYARFCSVLWWNFNLWISNFILAGDSVQKRLQQVRTVLNGSLTAERESLPSYTSCYTQQNMTRHKSRHDRHNHHRHSAIIEITLEATSLDPPRVTTRFIFFPSPALRRKIVRNKRGLSLTFEAEIIRSKRNLEIVFCENL